MALCRCYADAEAPVRLACLSGYSAGLRASYYLIVLICVRRKRDYAGVVATQVQRHKQTARMRECRCLAPSASARERLVQTYAGRRSLA